MWKLKFDDKEVACILEKRPSMDVEEVEAFNEDGTACWVPGKTNWLPLKN